MTARLRKLNDALPALILGIFLWGVFWQLAGVWFVTDKLGCSIGLWIGVLIVVGMSIHMAWSLDIAVDCGEKGAASIMTKHNMIRYAVVVVVLGAVMVTGIANPLTAFLGIMGLKVAAYLQPFTHKLFRR